MSALFKLKHVWQKKLRCEASGLFTQAYIPCLVCAVRCLAKSSSDFLNSDWTNSPEVHFNLSPDATACATLGHRHCCTFQSPVDAIRQLPLKWHQWFVSRSSTARLPCKLSNSSSLTVNACTTSSSQRIKSLVSSFDSISLEGEGKRKGTRETRGITAGAKSMPIVRCFWRYLERRCLSMNAWKVTRWT